MAQAGTSRIDTPTRLSAVVCLLVLVWIVTYWLWQPRRVGAAAPPVTFAPAEERIGPALPEPPEIANKSPAVEPPVADPLAAADPTPTTRVVPPAFTEYVVQEGDTVDLISQRHYGTTAHAAVILRANPFVDPTKLVPGRTRLQIPVDPQNIQGRVITDSGDVEAAPPTPAPSTVEHTITRHDTLWDIAEAYYGKGHLWRRIYDANRDVITNPDRPPVGKTIRIPPPPPAD